MRPNGQLQRRQVPGEVAREGATENGGWKAGEVCHRNLRKERTKILGSQILGLGGGKRGRRGRKDAEWMIRKQVKRSRRCVKVKVVDADEPAWVGNHFASSATGFLLRRPQLFRRLLILGLTPDPSTWPPCPSPRKVMAPMMTTLLMDLGPKHRTTRPHITNGEVLFEVRAFSVRLGHCGTPLRWAAVQ